MSLLQIINTLVLAIGIPAIVVALVYIGRKLQTLDVLETTSDKIKHNVKVISDYLIRNHSKFNSSELQAFSPLKLTDIGEKFIKDVGFEEIYQANEKEFTDFIDNEHPTLKYDVEIAAVKSIYSLYEKPFMSFLKVFFYNNPDRSLENTAQTLAVYIRDTYLAKHPEIIQ